MLNENRLRLLTFLIVAVIHILLIFFFAINMNVDLQTPAENARMMKLTDLSEIIPEPPPEIELPKVEAIAETMIETEEVPMQIIVAAGTITTPAAPSWDDYLGQHLVATLPKFNENDIIASLEYPPIALRSGIEGSVILELFIDSNGHIQRILIMKEEPPNRGFGESAIKAFNGKRGTPAYSEKGEPISVRYRYPVRFKIK